MRKNISLPALRAVLMVLLIAFGIGNAWADSNYYASLQISKAGTTAAGKVYVAKTNTKPTSEVTTAVTSDATTSSGGDRTFYYWVDVTSPGYYVALSGAVSGTYNGNTGEKSVSLAASTSADQIKAYTATATFSEITIDNGTASPATIAAEDNSTTSTANTCAITYATKGDAQNDFKTPSVGSATGNGTFTATWGGIASDGKATVNVKFVGDGTYGGKNKAAANRSRTSSAVVTLTSTIGNNKGTCTVNASFPNIKVSAGKAENISTISTTSKSSSATFAVQWADDKDDFVPTFPAGDIAGGGAWTVDSWTYTATDAKSGTITVNYTFNPQGVVSTEHSAKLVLTANSNAGGASNYVVISAVSEALASNDASVTYNNNTTNYGKLADAIAAANSQPEAVVKLLRNIPVDNDHKLTDKLVITGVMTLDLNSYTIEATGMSSAFTQIFRVDATTAALTIMDSRTGGTISGVGDNANGLNGIVVNNGALNIQGGTISITNNNTGTNAKAHAVRVQDGSRVLMSGGTINATTAGEQARGIYSTTTPANAQMVVVTGGTINTTAKAQSIGIECESNGVPESIDPDPEKANVILSGVIINAETSSAAEAYAVRTAAGVCMGIQNGTYNATSATTTATAFMSSGYTAVLGGTFNATATTTTARGLHVAAGIAAIKGGNFTAIAETDLANGADIESDAKLLVYGGTLKGRLTKIAAGKYAIGANVKVGGILEAQGGSFIGEAANTELTAKQTSYACGVYGVDGNSTITMSNATMRGELQSHNLSNGDVSTWNGGAYGFYSRSTNPCGLTNCTITAVSAYQGGFGLRFANTPAEVRNCTVTVTTTYAYNYGVFVGGASCDVKVYNSKFTCTSGTTYAYGLYAYNGTTYAENCEFNATVNQSTATGVAESYLYGVKVNTGKTATLKDCKVTATGVAAYSKNGYGLYVDGSMDVENTEVTVSNINTGAYAIFNTANTSLINIASGKFKATATTTGVAINGDAAANKQKLYGGYYTTNNNLSKYLPEGYMVETLTAGTEFNAGYKYQVRPAVDLPDPVCKIGSVNYGTLEEALEYASKNATSSNKLTILMVKNYTLPAGNYTLPQYTTLLVPMAGVDAFKDHPDRVYNSYSYPTCNIKLTFAEGAKMDVYGTIQTGGKQSAIGQISQDVKTANNGTPTVSYGWIYLSAGSSITLENGSQLYSWGYVTGAYDAEGKYLCEIDAKRGSTVHESFMIKDWRGGSATLYNFNGNTNKNNYKVFPLNQYYIQNIEVPIKFRPGSAEYCDGTVSAGSASRPFNDVKLIGVTNTGSFFEMANDDMSEDTWVRKWYNAKIDQQVYEVNSSASLNNITLSLYGTSFSSSSFVLPITNNMKIHLLTGSMNITQNTELLPGSEIEIDKEATAYIASGKSLYVFDLDEWNAFYTNEHSFTLPYSPSWAGSGKTCPRSRKVTEDAKVNVHGKFVVNGYIYTTAGGANIFSSNEDAGTITFAAAAPTTQASVWVNNGTNGSNGQGYTERKSNSAYLKNGDDTYEHTAGTILGNPYKKSWVYENGKWKCWEERGCFGYDNEDKPYAKPRAWVQLTSNEADPTTHLYTDAETGDRRFLVEEGCTWWEVEPSPYDGNKYKCVDKDYDGRYKYYEYVNNKWQEAKVIITWKNGSTTLATYDKALYGVRPTYLDANPTKDKTSTDYYTWLGWTKDSETGEFFAKEAELPEATANTTYYAYFQTNKFQYTITLKNYDEAVLDAKRWNAGETPTYAYTPLKPSTTAKEYTFDGWATSKTGAKAYEITGLPAASAAATYFAHYAEANRQYTVQWVNYDGTVLKEEKVTYNTTPSAPTTPTRPNDDYYTYTFDAWSPAIAAVAGDQTYTATYTYEKKVPKYTATFKNGSATVYTQNLKSGEVPVFDGTTPTKAATAQYTYTFDGWSTTNGGARAYATEATLPALTADVTYYAHFASTTNTYNVYWRSEDGKTLLHTDNNVAYGATPAYDGATPTKPRVGTTQYVHDGWSATVGGAKISSLPTISGDATYYAHFAAAYEVTFNMQGHGSAVAAQTINNGGKVSQPSAPTDVAYNFGGWYKEAACENAWNFGSDVVTGTTTLYAKWTIKTFTITWKDGSSIIKSESWNYGATPSFAYEKQETDKYTYTLIGWSNGTDIYDFPTTLPEVTGDAIYTARYNSNIRSYTITFVNDDNSDLQSSDVAWGQLPEYTSTPTSTKTDGIYQFTGWSPEIVTVLGPATYTAQYTKLLDVVVNGDQTLDVPVSAEVTTTTVHVGGTLQVAETKTLTTDDLILEATPTSSGEIKGAGTVTTTNAYFHFSQPGGFKARTWYAVAVPWQVNVPAYDKEHNGVYIKIGDGEFVQQELGSTFDLIYYDGERRAQGATKAWNYIEDDDAAAHIMYPGRAYMIYLTSDADVIRFKKNNEQLLYTNVDVARYASDNGNLADWNGIANPAIYKAYLNVGATEGWGQVYNAETKQYEMFNMSSNQLQVGQPIFVQSAVEGTIVANAASNKYTPVSAAPRRANGESTQLTRYEVLFAASDADVSDRIIVRTDEDKEADEYIVGQDLAKMGVSSIVPQLWIDRYDSKMCINTAIPVNNKAVYPLSLFVPQAGEYMISIQEPEFSNQNDMLYLTYDNRIIWNLTYSPYTASLEKGTNTHYGLRIVHAETPAATTDMEGAVVDAHGETRKVLIEDKVFIIRGDQVYSVDGQLVK